MLHLVNFMTGIPRLFRWTQLSECSLEMMFINVKKVCCQPGSDIQKVYLIVNVQRMLFNTYSQSIYVI